MTLKPLNKKGQDYEVIIILAIIAFLFMSVGYMKNITQHAQMRDNCEKYREQYKFDSRIEGNFWSWNGSYECFTHTKDGLKIHYNDFEISQNVEVRRLE